MTQAALGEVLSKSARRNTQREYETTLILRPATNKAGIQAFVDKMRRIFESAGGRLQRIDNWGLRTLAYPIARHNQGIYLYVRFLGGSAVVAELERNLKIYDEVVRYLTVLIDEDIDPEARPSEVTEELLDAASESAPDPVEVARKEEEERRAAEEAERKAEAERLAAERAAAEAARAAEEGEAPAAGDDAGTPDTPEAASADSESSEGSEE